MVEPPDDAAHAVEAPGNADAQSERPARPREPARQVMTWSVLVLVIAAIVILVWSILDSGPASAPSPADSPSAAAV